MFNPIDYIKSQLEDNPNLIFEQVGLALTGLTLALIGYVGYYVAYFVTVYLVTGTAPQ